MPALPALLPSTLSPGAPSTRAACPSCSTCSTCASCCVRRAGGCRRCPRRTWAASAHGPALRCPGGGCQYQQGLRAHNVLWRVPGHCKSGRGLCKRRTSGVVADGAHAAAGDRQTACRGVGEPGHRTQRPFRGAANGFVPGAVEDRSLCRTGSAGAAATARARRRDGRRGPAGADVAYGVEGVWCCLAELLLRRQWWWRRQGAKETTGGVLVVLVFSSLYMPRMIPSLFMTLEDSYLHACNPTPCVAAAKWSRPWHGDMFCSCCPAVGRRAAQHPRVERTHCGCGAWHAACRGDTPACQGTAGRARWLFAWICARRWALHRMWRERSAAGEPGRRDCGGVC
eukprot:352893-Chlamydomonas_euryale.AAC.1